MFALIDCNNFYASCERVFQPQLEKHPIVILSNNDGCVISRSNEAKKIGIPMGAPAFKYKHILKKYNVKIFSSNFPLYADMSDRVMKILNTYSPNFEIYSIDEAFIKFNGFKHFNLKEESLNMVKKVHKWTGIPISVGLAPTKGLAKIANKIAKKYSTKTKGLYQIDSEEKRIKALKWTAIEDVWGIGRKHTEKLKKVGAFTAYDFVNISDFWVKKNMSILELRLKKDLEGLSCIKLDETIPSKKSISTTRSFKNILFSLNDLEERISSYTSNCAEKLRSQRSCCNSLLIFIASDPFKLKSSYYKNSTVINLPFATDSSIILNKFALRGLYKIYQKNIGYKKAGIILLDLKPVKNRQLNFFNNKIDRDQNLMAAIDKMNMRFNNKIKLATQDLNETWKMKQENLSKRYTTRLDEIITIQNKN